jgi:S1-C subfamily serine protease
MTDEFHPHQSSGWEAHPPVAAPPAGSHRRASGPGRHRFGVAALVAALVAGGVAGAVSARLSGHSTVVIGSSPSASATAASSSSGVTIAELVRKVEPALVDITATGTTEQVSPVFGNGLDPFGGTQTQTTEAAGTGMILTSNGLVLTNAHVIAGASSIRVNLDGQTSTHPARLVGEDAAKDVALIQIEGVSGLPTVTLGNSAGVVAGDSVLAIGNALDLQTGGFSVSNGIISGLDRSIATDNGEHLTGMLQTDAAISSGDSGGPLVNGAGQVIGMDTATATSSSQNTAQNIGFAIPVNEIRSLIPELEKGNIGTPTFGSSAANPSGSSGSGVGNSGNSFGGIFGGF